MTPILKNYQLIANISAEWKDTGFYST